MQRCHLWMLFLGLGLTACGSGSMDFGGGVPPPPPPPSVAIINGVVMDTPTDQQPVPDLQVLSETLATTTTTAADGRFTVEVPLGTSQLFVQFPDGSQNIYELTIPSETQMVDAEFFTDPIAAASETPGVMLTPTLANPAGTAMITDPQDGDTITCAPPPEVCRFLVMGIANPVLGQPGTSFNVYVSVTPIFPPSGGTVPQFPAVSVDPVTGEWTTTAQIGDGGEFQAQPGDTFQILVFVTSETLIPGPPGDALRFDTPVDIPGVVHISGFIDLVVGERCPSENSFLVTAPARPVDSRSDVLTPTEIQVQEGDTISFTASGMWDIGLGIIGPDGHESEECNGCPVVGPHLGALIGRLGQDGSSFLIGSEAIITAIESGSLFLGSNDNALGLCDGVNVGSCFDDNTGNLLVSVCVTAE